MKIKQQRLCKVYKEYILTLGEVHTKEQFAKEIKYNRTNLSSAFNGNENYLGEALFKKIVKRYPAINYDFLTGNSDEMLKSDSISADNPDTPYVSSLRTDRILAEQQVDIYDFEAAAGLVELFNNPKDRKPIATMSIPNLPKCDGALFVRGDSMHPLLKSGDIVAYKEVHNIGDGFFWGEMYILDIDLDGDYYTVIKYIHKSDKADYIRLVSYNPDHSPKDVPLSCVRAMALIKASVRFNTIN